MRTGFDMLKGTPCAGCVHMGWSLLYDEPSAICTFKVRSRRDGRWVPGSWYCEKCGFEFYEPEEWKAEKAEAWAKAKAKANSECGMRNAESLKKNSVSTPENAVPLVRAIELLR